MKKISKRSIIFIIFCFGLTLLNIIFFKKAYSINNIHDNKLFYITTLLLSLIELIIIIFLFIKNKKNYPLEKIFLLIIIPIGLLYLIFIPVGQVPDEHNHYARSYSISEGYLVSSVTEEGYGYAKLPNQVYNLLIAKRNNSYKITFNNIKEKYDGEESNIFFTNTSLYNFIVYIPQVTGIIIGKILHLPILLIAYLARLFNFIVYTILIYFSIKLIPFLKKYIIFFALLPISIQEAISISSDALTISLAIFLISYILYLKYNSKKIISNKEYILLFIISFILSMCKIVYFPLVFFVLILPKEKFKTKKERLLKLFLIIFFCILINGLWTLYASRYLVETNVGVNAKEQVLFLITHPIKYLIIILRTIKGSTVDLIYQLYGRYLLLIDLDIIKFYPLISILISIYLIATNEKKLEKKDRLLSIFIFICVIALIFTSLYIQWTPLKRNVIWGLQGRYYIPIMLLIPLFVYSKKISSKKIENDTIFILGYTVFQSISALCFIIYSCM